MNEKKTLSERLKQSVNEIIQPFADLVNAPRALWAIYVSYLLEGLVYFGVLTILLMYLSDFIGLRESFGSIVVSFFTGGITLAMLFLGGLADKIGVRRALLLALGLMFVGRIFLAASGTFFDMDGGANSLSFIFVLIALFIVVIGYGTYQPASYAGIKQYTTKKNAAMGYALIYGLMNLGAFFSGVLSPTIRNIFMDMNPNTEPEYGLVAVYWVYIVLTLLAFLSIAFILTKKASDRAMKIAKEDRDKDKVSENSDEKNKDHSSQLDKPRKPLFDGVITILLAFFVLLFGVFIYNIITSKDYKAIEILSDYEYSLNQVNKQIKRGFDREDDLGELKRLVSKHISNVKEFSDDFKKPELNDPGIKSEAKIDESVFRLIKEKLRIDYNYYKDFTDEKLYLANLKVRNNEKLFNSMRVHGLYSLLIAYSLVADVDEEVINEQRRRFRNIGLDEEMVPLSEAMAKEIRETAALNLVPRLKKYISYKETYIKELENSLSDKSEYIILNRLKADHNFFKKIIEEISEAENKRIIELLSQKLLYDTDVLFDIANDINRISEENKIKVVNVLDSFVTSNKKYVKEVRSIVDNAVNIPFSTSFSRWLMRYGLFLIPAIILLILIVMIILRRRPEHPFNDMKFVYFIFILIPVQTLFAHNWLTLPMYINRAFAGIEFLGNDVGNTFEFFSNLNPILIFFLAPFVAAITSRANVYRMMIWGTFIMGAPTFLLTIGPNVYLLLLYILLMSIGEALWQPRFLQYVAEIAPEGKAGSYMGIAQFPWFLTKVVTGLYSGYFLAEYCPAIGPQNTEMMWFIYALIAMVSTAGLIMAKKWISRSLAERQS